MANTKRICKHCREYFLADEMVKCNAGWFCTTDHMIAWTMAKTRKQKKKEQTTKDKATRQKLKTVSNLWTEAAVAAQYYVRMRDYGKPCISCGNVKLQKHGGTIDGGHYRSKGSAKHLSLYTLNIFVQCSYCNRWEGGNSDYRINLVERIGIEKVEAIEQDNRPRHYTRDELIRLKRIFRKRGRWYEKRRKG